jgi:phosphatidylglycerophosphatase A
LTILIKIASKPPTLRFLFAHPAHLIACGFGSGLAPVAPGTFGTLFAWLTFPLFQPWLSDAQLLALLIAGFIGGAFAAQRTGADLGVIDHGSIVWDEIVPFWLVLLFCPPGLLWQGAAFLLFRLFDIVKPQPARYFDEKVKNGLGVMSDDLIAAGYTILVIAVAQFIVK